MSGIDARRVDEAAELLPRCLRARRRWKCYTEAAHRLGVTSRFLREAVERAEAAGICVEEVAGDPGPQAAGRRARHRFEPGRGTLVAGADRPGGDLRDVGRPWSEAERPWNPRVSILISRDYRPSSECPHDGPIAGGRRACCVACDKSGLDRETGMKVDPATASKPAPKVPKLHDQAATRAQRWKLLAELTADQRKELPEAERDARRTKRGTAEWERRGDDMGR